MADTNIRVTAIKVDTNFLILFLFYSLDVISMPNVATFSHYFKAIFMPATFITENQQGINKTGCPKMDTLYAFIYFLKLFQHKLETTKQTNAYTYK